MHNKTLMFGKTYTTDEEWYEDIPHILNPTKKVKRRKPSKKELLDSLEEHNDGYTDDPDYEMDRGE